MRPVRREDALGPRQSQRQDAPNPSSDKQVPSAKNDRACFSTMTTNKGNKMKFLIKANWPNENENEQFVAGKGGEIIQGILEEIKPEAVYFGIEGGQ